MRDLPKIKDYQRVGKNPLIVILKMC